MLRTRRSWWRCYVLAAMCLVCGPVLCRAEPRPGNDKPLHRPHVQTHLRPTAAIGARGGHGGHGGPSRVPVPLTSLGLRSPPLRAPSTSPLGGNKAPFSYQRTTSTGSSGYGSSGSSRSPSLSPPYRPAPSFPARTNPNAIAHNTPKKKPPCDCDCLPKPRKDICGAEPGGSDRQTFINECQLECHNCTMRKKYQIVAHVACESLH